MTSRAERNRKHKASTIAKAQEPKPETVVTLKPKGEKPEDRDGLEWLIRKKRLSARQTRAATTYRQAYREPQEGAMRSCLDDSARGGSGHDLTAGYNAAKIDAKRLLFTLRFVALKGHDEMITLTDGVCGGGLTIPQMVGQDSREVLKKEAVLKVALDLIALHMEPMSQPEHHILQSAEKQVA